LMSVLLWGLEGWCDGGVAADTIYPGFFKTCPPDVVASLSENAEIAGIRESDFADLQFRQINHENSALESGHRYGLVYCSKPVICKETVGLYFENSQFLKQFRIHLRLVDSPSDSKELIVRSTPVILHWKVLQWKLPESWRGKPLQLLVTHEGPYHPLSEFSFSDPFEGVASRPANSAVPVVFLFGKLLVFASLFLLPAMVFWVKLRHRYGFQCKPLFVFPTLLILITLTAYFCFVGFLFFPKLTSVGVVSMQIWSLLALGTASTRSGIRSQYVQNLDVRNSLWLLLLACLLSLFAGMMFGGWENIVGTSTGRYLESLLPADNQLPGIFVERLFLDQPLSPYFHGWLSSDRPPLQSALILWVRGVFSNPENDSQLCSILLQSLLIPCLYLLSRSAGQGEKRSFAIALSMVFTSSFFLNSFFVWPKLLPIAYLLITTILLFFPNAFLEEKQPHLRCVLIGLTSAFAMLTHGGSIFALFPLFATAILFWKLPHVRHWGSMILPFFCCMLPWMLYQKYFDPPGDRLVRWHIAGFTGPTDLSLPELLISQYRSLGWEVWMQFKLQNIRVVLGDWNQAFLHLYPYQFSNHFHLLRSGMFLSFFQSQVFQLPFLIVFPVVALFSRSGREVARRYLPLFVIALLGLAFWILMMFRPGRTIMHQGTYYLVYAFIVYFVAVVDRGSPRFSSVLLTLQTLLVSFVWVLPAISLPLTGQSWLIDQIQPDWIACFGYLAFTLMSLVFFWRLDAPAPPSR